VFAESRKKMDIPLPGRVSIYTVPHSFSWRNKEDTDSAMNAFFSMLHDPQKFGKREDFDYHESLIIGDNVDVYVPSAVTQKLKITVLQEIDGKQKKCAPYIQLPATEVKEVDNSCEYQDIRMLLVVQKDGKTFMFPIEGPMGQRGSTKEDKRSFKYNHAAKVVVFSRAKMPCYPVKQKLKNMGINHFTFMFLVNQKMVRDPQCNSRQAAINTDNCQGIGKSLESNREAFSRFSKRSLGRSDNDLEESEEETTVTPPIESGNQYSPLMDLPQQPPTTMTSNFLGDTPFSTLIVNAEALSIGFPESHNQNSILNSPSPYENTFHRSSFDQCLSTQPEELGNTFLPSNNQPHTTTDAAGNEYSNYHSKKRKLDVNVLEQYRFVNDETIDPHNLEQFVQSFTYEQLNIISELLQPLVRQKKKREIGFPDDPYAF